MDGLRSAFRPPPPLSVSPHFTVRHLNRLLILIWRCFIIWNNSRKVIEEAGTSRLLYMCTRVCGGEKELKLTNFKKNRKYSVSWKARSKHSTSSRSRTASTDLKRKKLMILLTNYATNSSENLKKFLLCCSDCISNKGRKKIQSEAKSQNNSKISATWWTQSL